MGIKEYLIHHINTFHELCKFEREHTFHPKRLWRFDFACVRFKIAIEYEGGIFKTLSGHRSMGGVIRDCEKYNEAVLLGWMLQRVHAKSDIDYIKGWIDQAVEERAKQGWI